MERQTSIGKRHRLLTIATDQFLARGYAAVSVDELVKSAGQSKTNVYSWFGGKEALFLASVHKLLDNVLIPLAGNDLAKLPLEEGLRQLSETVLAIVLSKEALALHRLVVAEAPTFPEIARAWVAAGPERTYGYCADFIVAHQAAGRLRAPDPKRAAIFLHDMLTGDLEHRMLIGQCSRPNKKARNELIDAVLDVFMRAYAT
jgi:TetR/AcrR family transcriptional repressor of mexJK operon